MDLSWDKLCTFSNSKGIKISKGGALLVEVDGDEVWIPCAMIDDKSEVWKEGDEGDLVIPIFFAEKKGL
jgi:hypothetical protein